MERDALIGHGTSFLLQDRLLNCSDYTQTPVCRSCGSILTTQTSVPRIEAWQVSDVEDVQSAWTNMKDMQLIQIYGKMDMARNLWW